MMSTLTTRQRDLLQILLKTQTPLGTPALASQMQLTPRQVNYDLNGLKKWLAGRNIAINATPGVGVVLDCTTAQHDALVGEIDIDPNFQLVLTAGQRQQLLALILLDADEAYILYQLQHFTQVSRTTILKDLDVITGWFQAHGLKLERRPNYGIWIEGDEKNRRQALAAWLWGETELETPLTQMTHTQGLTFALSDDADFLPIVQKTNEIINRWFTKRTFAHVAYAEAQLDGRFTDDAVLHLSLVLAIQLQRVQSAQTLAVDSETITWLKSLSIWSVAAQIARRLAWGVEDTWPEAEVANIAMQLLAAPRNERWPGDLEIDASFSELIDELVEHISQAYELPGLTEDMTLRDGIIIHIFPACLRYRFNLWHPVFLTEAALSEKYAFEHQVANEMASIIQQHTAVTLPEADINNMALLLRAAFIRERPYRIQDVIVVCPSGMATAQLLVARLKARFPRLGTLKVVSLRELTPEALTAVELIITTAPLPAILSSQVTVIQVHPLLLPEDVEKITRFMA